MIRMSGTLTATALVSLLLLGLGSTVAEAQSRIAGVVRDTTGAVLPGVTVEASSPVLIEKVRSGVSDGQGNYQIVDLRPGTYTVTFTLQGFSTVKHDGIDLPASFTATVNGEMRVGQVAETLTVTGEAPLVDVRSATQKRVIAKEDLEALPVLNRDSASYVATIPGVSGVNAGGLGFTQKTTAIHGGNGAEAFVGIDGFSTAQAGAVGGGGTTYYMNQANVQELAVKLSGGAAEQQMGGISTNVIPREGGNTSSGYFYAGYTNQSLVASNVTPELRAKGFTDSGLKRSWDYTPAFGGPVVKDKLWYYTSFRASGLEQFMPNLYVNLTPMGWAYTPDLTRPAYVRQTDGNAGLRLTWQASPRNKFNAFFDWQPHTHYNRNYSSLVSLEATTWAPSQPNMFGNANWSSPVSSRMLLEAGIGTTAVNYNPRRDVNGEWGAQRDEMPPQDFVTVSKIDSSNSIRFGSPNNTYGNNVYVQRNYRASLSYVTGAHVMKVGFSNLFGYSYVDSETNLGYTVSLTNGRPNQITEVASPNARRQNTKADLGIYIQDDWTVKRLTLNVGLRYDYFNGYVPAQSLPAGNFFAARDLARVDNVPNIKDISPRVGGAYDVFGDGKTAVKFAVGRYVGGYGLNQVIGYNPVTTSVLTVTRAWTDANTNFNPDCDLHNPLLNGECGQISNLNFGQSNPAATRTDPDVLEGWGKRNYNWNQSIELERQLGRGISASFGYFRRRNHTLTATDNLSVTPADYDPYCITAPLDSRLPGGGGYPVCGLYNIKPASFGLTNNFITSSKQFGDLGSLYRGFDLTGSARFPKGRVSGGASWGKTSSSNCFVIDTPQDLLFCDQTTPYLPNIRFSGNYNLPWGITTGVVYANLPGPVITATYQATNAEIRPTLGRNVSAGANALTNVPLLATGSYYGDRQQQLDLRLGKRIKVGRARFDASIDLQNLPNFSSTQDLVTTYGSTWLNPTQILNPRYLKFNLEVNF